MCARTIFKLEIYVKMKSRRFIQVTFLHLLSCPYRLAAIVFCQESSGGDVIRFAAIVFRQEDVDIRLLRLCFGLFVLVSNVCSTRS